MNYNLKYRMFIYESHVIKSIKFEYSLLDSWFFWLVKQNKMELIMLNQ